MHRDAAPPLPERSAVDLLEAAAGTDPRAAARWEALSRGLEALFPGAGAAMVAHARRAGLNPDNLTRVTFPDDTLFQPIAWFAPSGAADHGAAVTSLGVIYRRTGQ